MSFDCLYGEGAIRTQRPFEVTAHVRFNWLTFARCHEIAQEHFLETIMPPLENLSCGVSLMDLYAEETDACDD